MSYPLIDLHEDLLIHLRHPHLSPDGVTQTSIPLLESTPVKILVTTAFPLPPEDDFLHPSSNDLIREDLAFYNEYAETHAKWRIATTKHDIDDVLNTEGAHAFLLHIEGFNVPTDDPFTLLDEYYQSGLRSLGIVWNVTNPLGGGTLDPEVGITPLGRDVLAWSEANSLLVDFAHMNPVIMRDALAATTGPVYISHGNTCEHCPTPRNYSDEELRQVADRGGIIGPFFSKKFLVPPGAPAPIESVVAHFSHMRDVVGVEHIAVGTDFGGILSGFADNLTSLADMENLWNALRSAQFTESDIEAISYRNAARFLKENLPS